ncbi:hypothetical protein ACWEO1_06300 [Kitasatospora cineracea]
MDTNNSITGNAQVDTAVQAGQAGQVAAGPQTVNGPQFNGANLSVQYITDANGADINMTVNNQH